MTSWLWCWLSRDEIKDGRVQLGPEVLNQLMDNIDTVLSGTWQLAPATVSLFFMGLAELAVSDANKENLVQAGAVPRLKGALKVNREVLPLTITVAAARCV